MELRVALLAQAHDAAFHALAAPAGAVAEEVLEPGFSPRTAKARAAAATRLNAIARGRSGRKQVSAQMPFLKQQAQIRTVQRVAAQKLEAAKAAVVAAQEKLKRIQKQQTNLVNHRRTVPPQGSNPSSPLLSSMLPKMALPHSR